MVERHGDPIRAVLGPRRRQDRFSDRDLPEQHRRVDQYRDTSVGAAPKLDTEQQTRSSDPAGACRTYGASIFAGADASARVMVTRNTGTMPMDYTATGLEFNIAPSANLRGADLTDFNLAGADLSGVNLTNATMKGAVLNGANLTRREFRRARP